MIDEMVLEQLFDELEHDIAVPEHGADRVVEQLGVSRETRRPSARTTRVLMVAAVLTVAVGIGAVITMASTDRTSRSTATLGDTSSASNGNFDRAARARRPANGRGLVPPTTIATHGPIVPTDGPVDGAKIVKTGSLDLRVPDDELKPTVNRVTGVAVGLGGYVGDSKTDARGDAATAQVTLRVPVGNFETALSRISELPSVDVLGQSANGTDVTGQHTDLQAQLTAATAARDSFLAVLAEASTVGDILAVQDHLTAANTKVDQLQGQINLLNDQASLSAIAVTITEKVPKKAAAAAATPPSGMSKAWKDAREGFSDSIEWIVARSGGALIVLLAALLLVFAVRYLYPVLRRALL